MADVTPDWIVEMQRLRRQVAQQRVHMEGYKLEVLEGKSRIATAVGNYRASEIAIAEAKKNLSAMEKEHGAVGVDIDQVEKELNNG